MKISACIIALNEEQNLPRCLESLREITDEIVLVDDGSADRTREIAKQYGARVIEHHWEGFVGQKNFAISQAQYDWIFSIDADEEISEELKKEIQELKKNGPQSDGFEISRVVFYKGKWIRFGDWYPDRLVRLFKKEKGKFAGGAVHERLELDGVCQKLKGELYHYTYKDRQDHLKRIEKYSALWAETAKKEGKRGNLLIACARALWKFLRGFFIKGGWKGGCLGFEIACDNAYETFLKYKKLSQPT